VAAEYPVSSTRKRSLRKVAMALIYISAPRTTVAAGKARRRDLHASPVVLRAEGGAAVSDCVTPPDVGNAARTGRK